MIKLDRFEPPKLTTESPALRGINLFSNSGHVLIPRPRSKKALLLLVSFLLLLGRDIRN